MKKLTTAILLGALCTVPVAYANTPQPTVENAHTFLKEMAERMYVYGHGWSGGNLENFKSQNCETSFNFTLELANEDRLSKLQRSIIIQWDKVSQVAAKDEDKRFVVNGVISIPDSKWIVYRSGIQRHNLPENIQTVSFMEFGADSDVTRQRLIKAMDFIRQQCDTSHKHGF